MMNQELLRIVENIARDKNIERESIFADLEEAMISGVRKHFGEPEGDVTVHIDRETGEIKAYKDKEEIDMKRLGRIPAQTAKQVMIQKIRADERDSIYAEFIQRRGTVMSGTVVRYEGGMLVVNLDRRAEGIMPKGEQIMGQTHRPSERVRCLILEVKEASGQVRIVLSRTHPDFIRRLFEQEIPEIAEKVIETSIGSRGWLPHEGSGGVSGREGGPCRSMRWGEGQQDKEHSRGVGWREDRYSEVERFVPDFNSERSYSCEGE